MRSLYGKFLLFTLATMIGSAIIAFLIVNTYYHQFLKSENDSKNMHILNSITEYIETNPNINLEQYLLTQADVGYKLLLVKKTAGAPIMQTFGDSFRLFNLDYKTINEVLNGTDYHGMRDLPKETFVTGFFSDELANSVGTSFQYDSTTYALFLRPNIKMLFTEVHYLLGGLFIGMAIISIIAMIFVAHKLIQPLLQLTEATKKIGAGQFEVPLPIKSKDEIGQLAQSFTQMVDKLAQADIMQKQFITDVSHDFQTPLQQIKGYTTLIKEGNVSETEKERYLHIIETEADRLSNLSRQLLFLTTLDVQSESLKVSSFRLDEQMKHVLQRFRWQLEKQNLILTADLVPITIEGVEMQIEQLWENLLSNAIKYSLPQKSIHVQLRGVGDDVEVVIIDEGIGIPKEHLPYIFQRFYRADSARSSHIKGTGLGLAIVKRIVELHNGEITIQSTVYEGSEITVRLPKKGNH